MSSPPKPPAGGLDDRSKQELRRYRRRALACTFIGLAVFVGFVIAASHVEGRADELERTGARVPGEVTSVRGQGEGGSIVVEFTWQDRSRRETVHLGADSRRYQVGERLTVLVDPDDPQHVSVPGETNQSSWTVTPMIVALIGSAGMFTTGGWALARARRQRRLLRRAAWRRVPCRYVEIGCGYSVRGLVRLGEADDLAPILTLASMLRWRLAKSGLRGATAVEVAGDPTGYVVLRAPDRGPLLSARPPMTQGAAKRWRRSLDGDRR